MQNVFSWSVVYQMMRKRKLSLVFHQKMKKRLYLLLALYLHMYTDTGEICYLDRCRVAQWLKNRANTAEDVREIVLRNKTVEQQYYILLAIRELGTTAGDYCTVSSSLLLETNRPCNQ